MSGMRDEKRDVNRKGAKGLTTSQISLAECARVP